MIQENRPIRVLIVDDSAVVRMTFRALLEGEPGFEVVGEARDPYEARDFILSKQPDVLTLDIEMPKMDGLTFLRRIMQHLPKPVVIISSVAEKGSAMAMEALQIGAAVVVTKPMTAPRMRPDDEGCPAARSRRGEIDIGESPVGAACGGRGPKV